MAQYLSKFKIGEIIYNLKDAEGQQKLTEELAKLKAAAYKDVVEAVSESANLPTAAAVKAYVDSQVGSINKFDVVIDATGTSTGPSVAASADTMYKLYMVSDSSAEAGTYVEWITIRNGESYSWEKIGSTKTDLTGYVENTRKIAGLALNKDISVAELQDALGLKALAYKDSGSVAITTADSVTMGAYTPAGNVTLNPFTQTSTAAKLTKADYTPAGSVDGGKVTAAGSVSAAKAANGAFQVSGSISAPTVTVTPATASVQYVTNVGRAATFTEGAYTPGSFSSTSGNYNTDAIKAHVAAGAEIAGDVTAETLIFEAASTASAVATASYTPGNKAADTFDGGAVPTLGTAQNVVTGITSAQASAPTFTGDKFNFTFAGTEVAVSGASFTGTTAADVLVSEVKYDKATANGASFAGSAAELTGTLNKTEKTVDVTFA